MSDDQSVGYGRPPKSGQIKKGERRNPKGRPRKLRHVVLPTQILRDFVLISDMMIEIPTPNGIKKMTLNQGIVWNTGIQALKGKATSLKIWDRWMTETLEERWTVERQYEVVRLLTEMAQNSECPNGLTPEMLQDMAKALKKPF